MQNIYVKKAISLRKNNVSQLCVGVGIALNLQKYRFQ